LPWAAWANHALTAAVTRSTPISPRRRFQARFFSRRENRLTDRCESLVDVAVSRHPRNVTPEPVGRICVLSG